MAYSGRPDRGKQIEQIFQTVQELQTVRDQHYEDQQSRLAAMLSLGDHRDASFIEASAVVDSNVVGIFGETSHIIEDLQRSHDAAPHALSDEDARARVLTSENGRLMAKVGELEANLKDMQNELRNKGKAQGAEEVSNATLQATIAKNDQRIKALESGAVTLRRGFGDTLAELLRRLRPAGAPEEAEEPASPDADAMVAAEARVVKLREATLASASGVRGERAHWEGIAADSARRFSALEAELEEIRKRPSSAPRAPRVDEETQTPAPPKDPVPEVGFPSDERDELLAEIDKLTNLASAAKHQAAQLSTEKLALNERLVEMQDEQQRFLRDIQDRFMMVAQEAEGDLAKAKAEMEGVQRRLGEEEAKAATLRQRLTDEAARADQLEGKLEAEGAALKYANDKVHLLETQLARANEDAREQSTAHTEQQLANNALRRQLIDSKSADEALRGLLADSERLLQKQLEYGDSKELKMNLDQARANLQLTEGRVKEALEERDTLASAVGGYKREIADLGNEVARERDTVARLEKLQPQLDELRAELRAATQKTGETESARQALAEKLKFKEMTWAGEAATADMAATELKDTIEQLRGQLDQASMRERARDRQLNDLRASLEHEKAVALAAERTMQEELAAAKAAVAAGEAALRRKDEEIKASEAAQAETRRRAEEEADLAQLRPSLFGAPYPRSLPRGLAGGHPGAAGDPRERGVAERERERSERDVRLSAAAGAAGSREGSAGVESVRSSGASATAPPAAAGMREESPETSSREASPPSGVVVAGEARTVERTEGPRAARVKTPPVSASSAAALAGARAQDARIAALVGLGPRAASTPSEGRDERRKPEVVDTPPARKPWMDSVNAAPEPTVTPIARVRFSPPLAGSISFAETTGALEASEARGPSPACESPEASAAAALSPPPGNTSTGSDATPARRWGEDSTRRADESAGGAAGGDETIMRILRGSPASTVRGGVATPAPVSTSTESPRRLAQRLVSSFSPTKRSVNADVLKTKEAIARLDASIDRMNRRERDRLTHSPTLKTSSLLINSEADLATAQAREEAIGLRTRRLAREIYDSQNMSNMELAARVAARFPEWNYEQARAAVDRLRKSRLERFKTDAEANGVRADAKAKYMVSLKEETTSFRRYTSGSSTEEKFEMELAALERAMLECVRADENAEDWCEHRDVPLDLLVGEPPRTNKPFLRKDCPICGKGAVPYFRYMNPQTVPEGHELLFIE